MATGEKDADEIFKEFKEQSITQFFRKNSQMLGYSGKVRSLTTVVHEYVANSLDACEEAGIFPEISVEVKAVNENRHMVTVTDNGPGIPQKHIGKALASILSGTKFHRYLQQRGQQGIGAGGCTLFAAITTGKPIHARSGTGKGSFECDIAIDIKTNKPLITNMKTMLEDFRGTSVSGEFGDTKYERSDHGVYEYVKRTALSNPHATIKLVEPDGKETVFPRSVNEMPKRPKQTKPHPLGISARDLLDFAHVTNSSNISSFLTESFSRVSAAKIDELKGIAKDINFDKKPRELTWPEAEKLVEAFKSVKWIAPETDSLSVIGAAQMETAMLNIINPQFISVTERKPKIFKGGIPFVVEAGIAYGGDAGKKTEEGTKGTIMRFANKVPLLFDGSVCAITEAVNQIQWKRYGIRDFGDEPISVFVNISSVYIPYNGIGKQAVSQEPEIIEELKLGIMECARKLQIHINKQKNMHVRESRYKTIMRYVGQLSADLSDITGEDKEQIESSLKHIVESKYDMGKEDDSEEDVADSETSQDSAEE
jgi:DNA topoisomerase-6 subunit B